MEQHQNQNHNPDNNQSPPESDSAVAVLENPPSSSPEKEVVLEVGVEKQLEQESPSSDLGSGQADPGEKVGDFDLHEELQRSLDLKEGDSSSEVVERVEVVSEVKEEVWVKEEKAEEYDREEQEQEEEEEDGGGVGAERERREEQGGYGNIVKEQTQYPVRPEAEDCSYYMKTGTCKFGSNCKFNHPVRRKTQNNKEKVKGNEESADRPGQIECKYYLRSGGCKFGNDCRFNHAKGTTSAVPILELNFLGLPIRPGEKECPYYMRTGSCKYGAQCRFSHPDPTAGGKPEMTGFANGTPVALQGVSQATLGSWSSPGPINEPTPFMPMMFPPTAGVPTQSPELNGYQALYPERGIHPPPAYVMGSSRPMKESNVFAHKQPQQQTSVEEFPERPGQPECSYYLKTGDCKFKSNCKYHHPKNRISRSPPCALSDKGLPLRPGQNVCTYYSHYGICKFGPACKFDHPINLTSNASEVDSTSAFSNAMTDGANIAGSGNGIEAATQQPM